jgi:hypothetical protein
MWGSTTAYEQAPVALTIRALDGSGRPDPSRSGVVDVQLDDQRAQVASGGTSLAAQPDGQGERVSVSLSGGTPRSRSASARRASITPSPSPRPTRRPARARD